MNEPKASREELEKLMMEMEALKADASGYGEQEALSRSTMNEFRLAEAGLKALKEADKNQETLVPLGGRIFIKAKVDPKDKILVGVGRGVSVEKNTEDAETWVEARLRELDDSHSQILSRIQTLEQRMMDISQKAQAMYLELQEEAGQQGA